MSESNLSKPCYDQSRIDVEAIFQDVYGVGLEDGCRGDDLMNLRDNSSVGLIIKRKTQRTLYITPRFRFSEFAAVSIENHSMRSSR